MKVLEVFADVGCPFTHLGLRRLVAARAEHDVSLRLRVRAWPLEWVNGWPLDAEDIAREVKALRTQIAPDLFRGFDVAEFPPTSIPAFGLVAAGYAVSAEIGEELALRVRAEIFEHGTDVSDFEVLRRIGAPLGVAPFSAGDAARTARSDLDEGRRRGVQGSPHFFLGERSWFCPTLRIEPEAGGGLHIEAPEDRLDEFYDVVLG